MKFGLGTILLLIAVVLFLLAGFGISDENYGDFLGCGLAAFAGSFLATSLGYGDRTFGGSRT
jgi:hypothetical protein